MRTHPPRLAANTLHLSKVIIEHLGSYFSKYSLLIAFFFPVCRMDSSCLQQSNWMPKLNKQHFFVFFIKVLFKTKIGLLPKTLASQSCLQITWALSACHWPPWTEMQSLHLILYNFFVFFNLQSYCWKSAICMCDLMCDLMGRQIVFSYHWTWLRCSSHPGAYQLMMLPSPVLLHIQ